MATRRVAWRECQSCGRPWPFPAGEDDYLTCAACVRAELLRVCAAVSELVRLAGALDVEGMAACVSRLRGM